VSFVRPVADEDGCGQQLGGQERDFDASHDPRQPDESSSHVGVIVDSRREREQGTRDAVRQPLRGRATREPVPRPVLAGTGDEQVDRGAVSCQGLRCVTRRHVRRDLSVAVNQLTADQTGELHDAFPPHA
jgi:hypothetical protein